MLVSQYTQSVSEDLSLSKCESSSCTNRPVLWLKYPHTVCRTISTLLLLLARSADASASSFKMKQSSLFTVFSPMHTEVLNKLAVDLGSRPCYKNHCFLSIISYVKNTLSLVKSAKRIKYEYSNVYFYCTI